MGLFNMFSKPDIDAGVATCAQTDGAVLLDVREPHEFAKGHIPGAINVSVNKIADVVSAIPEKSAPVFVYCLSGGRAGRAANAMKGMGYENVTVIGGINAYSGKIER